MERETRTLPVELRVAEDGKSPVITGYAAVFGQWSEDLGGFRETIAQGAFAKTIQESDVRALWNHDANYPLGRNKAGTLRLKEDKKGLAIEIDPPNTQWASDLLESIRRGDVDQMSFGFQTIRDKWDSDDKNAVKRELQEVRLFDVSPVTFPAYPQTTVAVRAHVEKIRGIKTDGTAPADDSHPVSAASTPADDSHLLRDKRRRCDLALVLSGEYGRETK